MKDKRKCANVNLGKSLIKESSCCSEMREVSRRNCEILEGDIGGVYRFGCI